MKRTLCFLLIAAALTMLSVLPVSAEEDTAISFLLSSKSEAYITDGKITTKIDFDSGENISIQPNGAAGMLIKWYEPCAYDTEMKHSDSSTETTSYNDTILNKFIAIKDIESAAIILPEGGSICDIEFFWGEELPQDVQVWQEPYEKLDILVLSAHPDDEYLYFGGTLPYYGTELGLDVNCVWMSHQKRLRQDEALSALWAMGIRHYPEFLGFPDKLKKTYADAAQFWGEEETLKAIVEIYRKYKPEVVITHDLKGEYGHGAHMLVSALSLKAAKIAADETQFPESAQKYGIWQIKKLYLHLYKREEIYMAWDKPMEAFGGKTAMEMAKIGYSYHESQHIYNFRVDYNSKYACTKFGLAFSTVGIDIHGRDFLENIAAKNFSNYAPPQPKAT